MRCQGEGRRRSKHEETPVMKKELYLKHEDGELRPDSLGFRLVEPWS